MMKNKLCRLCSKNDANRYLFHKNVNNIDLCTKVKYCTKLDIKEKDGFPSFICESCEQELEDCYQFILKCENTEKYLRSVSYALDSQDNNLRSRSSLDDLKTELKYPIENDHFSEDILSDSVPFPQHNPANESLKLETFEPEIIKNTEDKVKENTDLQLDNIKLQIKQKASKTRTGYKNSRSHKCSVCARDCTNQSALIIHMRSHSDCYPFVCSLCDKKYKDGGSLKRHMSKHNSICTRVRNFICESCGKAFFRQADVTVHMRTHTGETPYACNECSAKFTQLGALLRHKKRHTGEKDHMCSICPKRFCTKEELKMHHSVHSTEKKFKCPLCNTAFKHQSNLTKHKKRHLESHNFICNYCQRNFKFKCNLKLHIERRHSEKSGYCELCSRHAPNLETHMWRHNGQRPFKCEQCGSSFYELRALARHINFKHTKTNRYKCDIEECSMMFPSRPMLDFHIAKLHSSEVPFPCDQCARAFYRKNDLARHKIGTHKEKCL